MPKLLTPAQVDAYERDGFVYPIDVLTPEVVTAFRGDLQAWEAARGAPIDFPEKSKSSLLFNWADPPFGAVRSRARPRPLRARSTPAHAAVG